MICKAFFMIKTLFMCIDVWFNLRSSWSWFYDDLNIAPLLGKSNYLNLSDNQTLAMISYDRSQQWLIMAIAVKAWVIPNPVTISRRGSQPPHPPGPVEGMSVLGHNRSSPWSNSTIVNCCAWSFRHPFGGTGRVSPGEQIAREEWPPWHWIGVHGCTEKCWGTTGFGA